MSLGSGFGSGSSRAAGSGAGVGSSSGDGDRGIHPRDCKAPMVLFRHMIRYRRTAIDLNERLGL